MTNIVDIIKANSNATMFQEWNDIDPEHMTALLDFPAESVCGVEVRKIFVAAHTLVSLLEDVNQNRVNQIYDAAYQQAMVVCFS